MVIALAGGLVVAASAEARTGGAPTVRTNLVSCTVFPSTNAWHKDISKSSVHPKSAAWVKSIGASTKLHPDFGTSWQGAPIGIPYITVTNDTPKVPVSFTYKSESDKGPYPIPTDAPIEGGSSSTGDRHVIVINTTTCHLYELFNARPVNGGASWKADSGAIFNLKTSTLRPAGWTSADAAGLPIFAGLVRYDEVKAGKIDHALRFTVSKTQRGYVFPARHFASSSTNANLPPMGARFRLKASYSCAKYSKEVQVICAALKKYGMIVADNGSNWYVSGAHDSRWNDDHLGDLKKIPGSAFEAVYTGAITTK